MSVVVLALLIVALFVLIGVNRNRRVRSVVRSATTEVAVDARGARRELADGRREEVDWDEVVQVDVFTTRKGPHRGAGGAVVLYGTAERGCIVPLDRLEESGLLVHLGNLPGFKVATLIDALRDDEVAQLDTNPLRAIMPRPWQTTTVCWRRPGYTGTGPDLSSGTPDAPDAPDGRRERPDG